MEALHSRAKSIQTFAAGVSAQCVVNICDRLRVTSSRRVEDEDFRPFLVRRSGQILKQTMLLCACTIRRQTSDRYQLPGTQSG